MKRSVSLLVVVLLAAVAGGWWWTQRAPQAGAPGAAAGASAPARGPGGGPQAVTTTLVQQRDVPVTLEAAGTVVSLNSVDVRAQVATTVRSVAIQEGQFVRKGELLFTFDDRADRANLDRARAQLARDRAVMADLQRQLKRSTDLVAQNFIAQSNVDGLQAQVDGQLAAIRADEATVQASEVALSFGSVQAPLSGRAGAVAVYPGSLAQPGGAALVTISQIDPIGVSFNVPEAQLASLLRSQQLSPAGKGKGKSKEPAPVKAGASGAAGMASASTGGKGGDNVAAPARPGSARASGPAAGASAASRVEASNVISVTLPSERGGRGAPPPEAMQGTISFIDNAVDVSTGTIRVKGALPNARQQLWPGQYVTVRMTLRVIKDALVVPVAALIQRGPERSLYVVGADGKVEQRVVQQRYVFGDSAVVEGVTVGERIVVEGKQNLRSGTQVRESGPEGGRAASAAGGASAAGAGASASAGRAAAGAMGDTEGAAGPGPGRPASTSEGGAQGQGATGAPGASGARP
jgi:multidrug efflux pump subunit AcrA (membrane-fusion protein)